MRDIFRESKLIYLLELIKDVKDRKKATKKKNNEK